MRRDNNDPDSPRKTAYVSPRAPEPSSVRDDLFGPPPVQTTAFGEQSHARGGHGIFGMPKVSVVVLSNWHFCSHHIFFLIDIVFPPHCSFVGLPLCTHHIIFLSD